MRGAATKSMSDIVEERQQSSCPSAAAPLWAAARRAAGRSSRWLCCSLLTYGLGIARRSRLANGNCGTQPWGPAAKCPYSFFTDPCSGSYSKYLGRRSSRDISARIRGTNQQEHPWKGRESLLGLLSQLRPHGRSNRRTRRWERLCVIISLPERRHNRFRSQNSEHGTEPPRSPCPYTTEPKILCRLERIFPGHHCLRSLPSPFFASSREFWAGL